MSFDPTNMKRAISIHQKSSFITRDYEFHVYASPAAVSLNRKRTRQRRYRNGGGSSKQSIRAQVQPTSPFMRCMGTEWIRERVLVLVKYCLALVLVSLCPTCSIDNLVGTCFQFQICVTNIKNCARTSARGCILFSNIKIFQRADFQLVERLDSL